jgi:hypothetical protein
LKIDQNIVPNTMKKIATHTHRMPQWSRYESTDMGVTGVMMSTSYAANVARETGSDARSAARARRCFRSMARPLFSGIL